MHVRDAQGRGWSNAFRLQGEEEHAPLVMLDQWEHAELLVSIDVRGRDRSELLFSDVRERVFQRLIAQATSEPGDSRASCGRRGCSAARLACSLSRGAPQLQTSSEASNSRTPAYLPGHRGGPYLGVQEGVAAAV